MSICQERYSSYKTCTIFIYADQTFLETFFIVVSWRFKQNNLNRRNPSTDKQQVAVGDIVLIKEDCLPRNCWRMGRVTKLIIGRDGHCRGVKLCTSSKTGRQTTCSRPLKKLVPLLSPESRPKEICTQNESVSSSESTLGDSNIRVRRKAAMEGQNMRRLREKFA